MMNFSTRDALFVLILGLMFVGQVYAQGVCSGGFFTQTALPSGSSYTLESRPPVVGENCTILLSFPGTYIHNVTVSYNNQHPQNYLALRDGGDINAPMIMGLTSHTPPGEAILRVWSTTNQLFIVYYTPVAATSPFFTTTNDVGFTLTTNAIPASSVPICANTLLTASSTTLNILAEDYEADGVTPSIHAYRRNYTCLRTITAPGGTMLRINVLPHHLQVGDAFMIFDGDTTASPAIFVSSGTVVTAQDYYAFSGKALIYFMSGDTDKTFSDETQLNARAWVIEYIAMDPFCDGSTRTVPLSSAAITFSYPPVPADYGSVTTLTPPTYRAVLMCRWLFDAGAGSVIQFKPTDANQWIGLSLLVAYAGQTEDAVMVPVYSLDCYLIRGQYLLVTMGANALPSASFQLTGTPNVVMDCSASIAQLGIPGPTPIQFYSGTGALYMYPPNQTCSFNLTATDSDYWVGHMNNNFCPGSGPPSVGDSVGTFEFYNNRGELLVTLGSGMTCTDSLLNNQWSLHDTSILMVWRGSPNGGLYPQITMTEIPVVDQCGGIFNVSIPSNFQYRVPSPLGDGTFYSATGLDCYLNVTSSGNGGVRVTPGLSPDAEVPVHLTVYDGGSMSAPILFASASANGAVYVYSSGATVFLHFSAAPGWGLAPYLMNTWFCDNAPDPNVVFCPAIPTPMAAPATITTPSAVESTFLSPTTNCPHVITLNDPTRNAGVNVSIMANLFGNVGSIGHQGSRLDFHDGTDANAPLVYSIQRVIGYFQFYARLTNHALFVNQVADLPGCDGATSSISTIQVEGLSSAELNVLLPPAPGCSGTPAVYNVSMQDPLSISSWADSSHPMFTRGPIHCEWIFVPTDPTFWVTIDATAPSSYFDLPDAGYLAFYDGRQLNDLGLNMTAHDMPTRVVTARTLRVVFHVNAQNTASYQGVNFQAILINEIHWCRGTKVVRRSNGMQKASLYTLSVRDQTGMDNIMASPQTNPGVGVVLGPLNHTCRWRVVDTVASLFAMHLVPPPGGHSVSGLFKPHEATTAALSSAPEPEYELSIYNVSSNDPHNLIYNSMRDGFGLLLTSGDCVYFPPMQEVVIEYRAFHRAALMEIDFDITCPHDPVQSSGPVTVPRTSHTITVPQGLISSPGQFLQEFTALPGTQISFMIFGMTLKPGLFLSVFVNGALVGKWGHNAFAIGGATSTAAIYEGTIRVVVTDTTNVSLPYPYDNFGVLAAYRVEMTSDDVPRLERRPTYAISCIWTPILPINSLDALAEAARCSYAYKFDLHPLPVDIVLPNLVHMNFMNTVSVNSSIILPRLRSLGWQTGFFSFDPTATQITISMPNLSVVLGSLTFVGFPGSSLAFPSLTSMYGIHLDTLPHLTSLSMPEGAWAATNAVSLNGLPQLRNISVLPCIETSCTISDCMQLENVVINAGHHSLSNEIYLGSNVAIKNLTAIGDSVQIQASGAAVETLCLPQAQALEVPFSNLVAPNVLVAPALRFLDVAQPFFAQRMSTFQLPSLEAIIKSDLFYVDGFFDTFPLQLNNLTAFDCPNLSYAQDLIFVNSTSLTTLNLGAVQSLSGIELDGLPNLRSLTLAPTTRPQIVRITDSPYLYCELLTRDLLDMSYYYPQLWEVDYCNASHVPVPAPPPVAPPPPAPPMSPSVPTCPPPANLTHGTWTASQNSAGSAVVTFACDSGYQLSGCVMTTCVNGAWDHSLPACVEYDAAIPPPKPTIDGITPALAALRSPVNVTIRGSFWNLPLRHVISDGAEVAESDYVVGSGNSRRVLAGSTLALTVPAHSTAGYYSLSLVDGLGLMAADDISLYFTDDCPTPGTFGVGVDCHACPTGGLCPGGNRVWPTTGYWNDGETSGYVTACPEPPSRCIGGRDSSCAAGYHGPLCGSCDADYYLRGTECVVCPSQDDVTALYVVAAIFFAALAVCFCVLTDIQVDRVVTVLKILQLIRAGTASTGSSLPEGAKLVLSYLSLVTFDFDFIRPTCGFFATSPYFSTLFWGNAVIVALVFVPSFVALNVLRVLDRKRREFYHNRIFRSITIQVALLYYVIATRTLSAVTCLHIGTTFRLAADPSVVCSASSFTVMGGIALLVFTVCVPLGYQAYVHWLVKNNAWDVPRTRARVGFLYSGILMDGRRHMFIIFPFMQLLVSAVAWTVLRIGVGAYVLNIIALFIVLVVAIGIRPFESGTDNAVAVLSYGIGLAAILLSFLSLSTLNLSGGVIWGISLTVAAISLGAAAIMIFTGKSAVGTSNKVHPGESKQMEASSGKSFANLAEIRELERTGEPETTLPKADSSSGSGGPLRDESEKALLRQESRQEGARDQESPRGLLRQESVKRQESEKGLLRQESSLERRDSEQGLLRRRESEKSMEREASDKTMERNESGETLRSSSSGLLKNEAARD